MKEDYSGVEYTSVDGSDNHKSSNNAKRAAVGAGLAVGGVGAGYAASTFAGTNPEVHVSETDSVPDLDSGARAGAEHTVVDEPEQEESSQVEMTEHASPATAESQSDLSLTETDTYYVDGEEAGSVVSGTYDGHDVALVDDDGDEKADYLWYDQNNNHQVDDGELGDVRGDGYTMNYHTEEHNNYYNVSDPDEDIAQNDNNDSIHNDFDKDGENLSDYNNHGDVSEYDASTDEHDVDHYDSHESDYMALDDSADDIHDNGDYASLDDSVDDTYDHYDDASAEDLADVDNDLNDDVIDDQV